MNIIQFIYRLLNRFVPASATSIAALEDEAKEWYGKYTLDENKNTWQFNIITNYLESWWFRTMLMILFIFFVRWIQDFMNPKDNDNDLDD